MSVAIRPLLSLPLAEICVVYNEAFGDYVVDLSVDEESLLREMVLEGVDAAASRLAVVDGVAAGVALVARSGWDARITAMAVAPAARGRGAGRALIDGVIGDARAAGVRRLELEVIVGNAPAQALYDSAGFRPLRRLVSYALSSAAVGIAAHLEEVHIAEVARRMAAHGPPDLPWQIRAETLVRLTPPERGYSLDGAYVVVSDPGARAVRIRGLVTEPGARGLGRAAALIGALMARFPDRAWEVPALCPEEAGGVFERMGFRRGELSQHQMVLEVG